MKPVARGVTQRRPHRRLNIAVMTSERIAKVTADLARFRREHRSRMRRRREAEIPMVTVVGCYNAGKTSLFNALTGAEKEVSDRPFTTLASKWSRMGNPNLLIADTIGFALNLDPELISAFQLNLDDMRAADVLLLVVDASEDLQVLKMKRLRKISEQYQMSMDNMPALNCGNAAKVRCVILCTISVQQVHRIMRALQS